jgi:HK97 family phage portal protein
MGWLDKLFHRQPRESKFARTLNGLAPVYTQFGTNIYASDVVQQALACIVDEVKKLNPQHIRIVDNDPVPISTSTVQAVLNDPNAVMTTAEFLEKITWLLLLNYNAFVIPTYRTWTDRNTGEERRYYEALYPIKPTQVNFIQDSSGRMYVQFFFESGYSTTVPYDDVIHIKYHYSVSEFMGGDWNGQPDHGPLLETLNLNDKMLKGIAKAMNASYAINGVIKYNTLLDQGKTEKALQELTEHLQNSESGFLPIDLKAEFVPLKRDTKLIDADTLKFMDEKILRNWGVPLAILRGDYNKVQYAAFYQKTLEPLIITISQAFTKKMFTKREKSFGNKIQLYPKDLVFMTVDQTIEMVTLLANTGAIFENEKRVAFGLRPLPELEGKRYMSLNWIDSNQEAAYRASGNVKTEVIDEEETNEDI